MIQCSQLSKRFGPTVALDELDLSVEPGEVFGFLGPNGAGKTTTIRLLLGLVSPSAGRCRVLGMDVASNGQAIRARCGALLEATGLYESLSVEENLRFHAGLQGLPRSMQARRMGEVLERLGLIHKRHAEAGTLSCGMKQKLGIARAMLHEPSLLFLDEPTRGLDPAATAELRSQLVELARDGVTLFITSHNLAEIERMCDRVGLIFAGRLARIGRVEDIRRAAGMEKIRMSAPNHCAAFLAWIDQTPGIRILERSTDSVTLAVGRGMDMAPLIRAALDHGVSLQEVRREAVSLESAYLELVRETRDAH